MADSTKNIPAAKLKMKRVLSCMVVGHFGLIPGEVWWMNHHQSLLWCEEELAMGGEVRIRLDMDTGADLVDVMVQVDTRLPLDFCRLPKGHLHLGDYGLVEEGRQDNFRRDLARANPALKLFDPGHLPPQLTRHVRKASQAAEPERSPRPDAEEATPKVSAHAIPLGGAASQLRKRAIKKLKEEQERQELEEAREEELEEAVSAEEQRKEEEAGERRRFEDILRQKMGAEGEALAEKEREEKSQRSLSGEAVAVPVLNKDSDSDPGFGDAVAEHEAEPDPDQTVEETPSAKARARQESGQSEPPAAESFEPREITGLDALILAAEGSKKREAEAAKAEPDEGLPDGVADLVGAWIEETSSVPVEDAVELSDDDDDDVHLSSDDDDGDDGLIDLTDGTPDEDAAEDEEADGQLELELADEPSFKIKDKEPDVWEFDASTGERPAAEQEPEPEPEPEPEKPKKPKLDAETRRLLPAALGPGKPPSIMLRVADPAQLRRTLDLNLDDWRAVFRIRPEPKLEAGDPVKLFLSLPGNVYLELEGLVYDYDAPGTHMVVEPLQDDDFGTLRDMWEER